MKVCILTSGGDSPGMNAAIRSIVRSSIDLGHEVFGAEGGYDGLIQNQFQNLNLRSVANVIHRGGTFLKSSRSKAFKTHEGRQKAYNNLKALGVEVLIGLGGDGTLKGLEVFQEDFPDMCSLGLPCTIDNDYAFSEKSIGFDTALNNAVEVIDKIRDTAGSHQRTFVVEVMGRESKNLALHVALAAGAEQVIDLKEASSMERTLDSVQKSIQKGKKTSLLVVLEHADVESAAHFVQKNLNQKLKLDCRSMVLGHLQRGGSPTAKDRNLASLMGYELSKHIESKKSGVVVVSQAVIQFKSFTNLKKINDNIDMEKIIKILAN